MFWDENFCYDDFMEDPDVTIQKFLDCDHCLEICRLQDQRVLTLLSRKENLDFIVDLISTPYPVSEELDINLYRHSSTACEILTGDLEALLDGILQTEPDIVVQASTDTDEQSSTETFTSSLSCAHTTVEVCPGVSNGDRITHFADTGQNQLTKDATTVPLSGAVNSSLHRRPRLDRLLRALETPINALSASFLSRVLAHLAFKRGSIVVPYMRSFPNFLEHVLNRFDLTAVADLVLQLVRQDLAMQGFVLEWFIEDNLIPRLIDRFDIVCSNEVHQSVAHCLVKLTSILRTCLAEKRSMKNPPAPGPEQEQSKEAADTGLPANNPCAITKTSNGENDSAACKAVVRMLDVLESEETMRSLFSRLVGNPDSTSSVAFNCLAVLIALINRRNLDSDGSKANNDDVDFKWDQWLQGGGFHCTEDPSAPIIGTGLEASASANGGDGADVGVLSGNKLRLVRVHANLIKTSISFLPNLHVMLQRAHQQECNRIPTTVGILDPPFGRLRTQLVQFLAIWINLTDYPDVAEAVLNEGLVRTLMDLFEHYPFNTLMHHAVINFIRSICVHAKVISRSKWKSKLEEHLQESETKSVPTSSNHWTSEEDSMDVDSDQPATSIVAETDVPPSNTLLILPPKLPPWDELFTSLFTVHQITDWCLRLSPLPVFLTVCRRSTKHPMPGYSGHLWRLANLIERCRTGLRVAFVQAIFDKLPPTSVSAWDTFCSDSLAKINESQLTDTVCNKTPRLPSWTLETQPGPSLRFPPSLVNAGKFSLELSGPPAFCSVMRTTGLVDLNIDPNLPPPSDEIELTYNSPMSLHDFHEEDFLVPRIIRKSSDPDDRIITESPDMKDYGRNACSAEEDTDDEEEEEEEDELHSPVVIKQQRTTTVPRTPPIIGLNQYTLDASPTELLQINPWENVPEASSMNNSNSPIGWIQFDDGTAQLSDNATAWPLLTGSESDDHRHSMNGVQFGCTAQSDEPNPDLYDQSSEQYRSSDTGKTSPSKSPILTSGEMS